MKAHKIKTDRKIITIQEWAKYLKLSRHTVNRKIAEYEKLGFEYDARDVYSVLNLTKFFVYKKVLS